MLNKDYLAVKDLAKLRIDGNTYFRILHHLGKFITNVTVFELAKNTKDGELSLTELSIEEVPLNIQPKIMSSDYQVDVLNDDKSLILEAFKTKMLVMKDFAEKHINVGMKRKLMRFMEVGGYYFGFIYEEGMPYTKLYRLNIDPVSDKVVIDGVAPEMLPALFESLSPTILGKATELTIQVDDGAYARVSLMDNETALVTVVTAHEKDSGETQLRIFSGFALTKRNEKEWAATIGKEADKERIQESMKKSFEVVYQELLMRVYEVNGQEALKGI